MKVGVLGWRCYLSLSCWPNCFRLAGQGRGGGPALLASPSSVYCVSFPPTLPRVLIDYLPSCFNSVVSEAAFLRRPGRLSAPVMLLYTWVLLGGLLLFIMSYFVFFYSSFFDLFIFIFSRYSFIYVSRHLAAACTTRSCSWRIRRREAAG